MGSILSLIFEKKVKTKLSNSLEVFPSTLAEIQIDASINIDHQMTNTLTSNPVEDGGVVSDNVTRNNRQLTLDGMIVNHPIIDFNFFGMLSLLAQGERSQNGFEILKKIWENAEPFRLETKRDTYDPVIITSLKVTENVDVGDGLRFNMTVEEVTLVQSGIAPIPITRVAEDVQGAASVVNRGKQAASNVTSAVEDKSRSILSTITGLR